MRTVETAGVGFAMRVSGFLGSVWQGHLKPLQENFMGDFRYYMDIHFASAPATFWPWLAPWQLAVTMVDFPVKKRRTQYNVGQYNCTDYNKSSKELFYLLWSILCGCNTCKYVGVCKYLLTEIVQRLIVFCCSFFTKQTHTLAVLFTPLFACLFVGKA